PPFRPFLFHFTPSGPIVDDARKHTFFSFLVEQLLGSGTPSVESTGLADEIEPEPEPSVFYEEKELIEIQVSLSPATKLSRFPREHFLKSLTYCSEPMSFEVLGLPDEILVQITCRERDLVQLKQQLTAYFPEAVLSLKSGYLIERWKQQEENETVIIDFG